MIVIRPISRKDLSLFDELPFESMLGMTTLPREKDQIQDKIILSETSFLQNIEKPGLEEYYFVLEDLTTGHLGGICGILAKNTIIRSYSYRIETVKTSAKHISAPKELKILCPIRNTSQTSEVCSLYLLPEFRHSGLGRLLSLSRFLFIAAHKQRLENKIVVEMRGYVDQQQVSPFWNAIGRHFCNITFTELMIQLDQDREFISEILPKYPLYIDLLPQEVQEVIGKTHDGSKPALNMLMQEGFTLENEIDIFDGGPLLSASVDQIRTIKQSSLIKVSTTTDPLTQETDYILGNERIHFRCCFGKVRFLSETEALIHQDVADALLISKGDTIRYVTIH